MGILIILIIFVVDGAWPALAVVATPMTTSWHLVASLVIKIFDIVKIVVVTSVIIVTHHFNFVMVLDHIAMVTDQVMQVLNVLFNNVDGQCDVDNPFIAVDDPQGHVESRRRLRLPLIGAPRRSSAKKCCMA